MKRGFFISVRGTLVYDCATRIRSVAGVFPLRLFVLTNGSLNIPPESHHKERNRPK